MKVLDGGVSSTLADQLGKQEIHGDNLWSSRLIITDPTAIQQVHRLYLDAGSDVITTVTYQSSVQGFMTGCSCSKKEALAHMIKGAALAVQARDEFWQEKEGNCLQKQRPLVAGSLGPYGVLLCDGSEYTGSYIDNLNDQDLENFHRPRIACMVEGGVDLICFETIPSQREAEVICRLMKEFPTVQAWLAFSCKDGEHISHGEKLADAIMHSVMSSQNIMGVGINCTAPQFISSLLKSIPEEVFAKKKVVVYPNKGQDWDAVERCYKEGANSVSTFSLHLLKEWIDCGARWLGGCCQTTPKDIETIAAFIDML